MVLVLPHCTEREGLRDSLSDLFPPPPYLLTISPAHVTSNRGGLAPS